MTEFPFSLHRQANTRETGSITKKNHVIYGAMFTNVLVCVQSHIMKSPNVIISCTPLLPFGYIIDHNFMSREDESLLVIPTKTSEPAIFWKFLFLVSDLSLADPLIV